MPPVKEASASLLILFAGKRVIHSDNHTQRLSIAPIVEVSATISNVASQVVTVAFELAPVLTRFAEVVVTNVAAYLTSVGANLATVSTNLSSIASNLRLGGNSSEGDECCTRQNFLEH